MTRQTPRRPWRLSGESKEVHQTMIILRRSRVTRKIHEMDLPITREHLAAWYGGKTIAEVMPHLSSWEREFVVSGITRQEWIKAFGPIQECKYCSPGVLLEVGGQ